MRHLASLLCASALLLAVAACSDDDATITSDTSASDTSASDTSPSASTTAPPPDGKVDVMSLPFFSDLNKWTYIIDPDGDPTTPLKVTYDVAQEGWSQWIGAVNFPDEGHVALSITTVTNLVKDGCTDHSPANPAVGPTVDDLATALSHLAPFEVTEAPSDVTLLGYEGKHLELRVPDLAVSNGEFPDCQNGELNSWFAENLDGSFHGYGAEPGRYEEFWILDVDGTRLVLATTWSLTSEVDVLIDLDNMIDSIQIEP